MRRLYILIPLLFGACSRLPMYEDYAEMQTKQALREAFGEPESVTSTVIRTPDSKLMWGPGETFWGQSNIGDSITTWIYSASGGRAHLFFLGESDSVRGHAFDPEGAVY